MKSGIPIIRLTTILLLPITLVLIVMTILMVWSAIQEVDRGVEAQLESVVEAVSLAGIADSLDWSVRLEELALRNEYDRIWILDHSWLILASNLSSEVGSTVEDRWQQLLEGKEDTLVQEEVPWGQRTILFSARWSIKNNLWTAVLYDNSDTQSLLRWRIVRIIAVNYLIWLVMAGIMLYLVRRNISRPLSRVEQATIRLLEGEEIQEAKLKRLVLESGRTVGGIVGNVTELIRNRQLMEQRLQNAGILYATLFDLLPDMVLVISMDGTILEANRSFCNVLGFSQSTIRGTTVKTLSAHVPADALLAFGRKCREQNCKIENLDFLFRSRDGKEVPANVTVQGVNYHGGPAIYVIATDRRDIQSLYKQLAAFNDTVELMVDERTEQTRQSAAYWTALTRLNGVLLGIFNYEGLTVHWSEKTKERTGFPMSDVPDVSHFVKKLIPEAEHQGLFYNWIMQKGHESFVCTVNTKTNISLQVAWTKIDIRDGQKRALHVIIGIEQGELLA